MLLVETYIDCTEKMGVGLFAKKFIKKGTMYWTRNESFDRLFTESEMDLLEEFAVFYIKKYGFMEMSGHWYLCNDNARFSNHSDNPNSEINFNEKGIAQYYVTTKDIQPGEQLLIDYRKVCQTCVGGVDFKPLN